MSRFEVLCNNLAGGTSLLMFGSVHQMGNVYILMFQAVLFYLMTDDYHFSPSTSLSEDIIFQHGRRWKCDVNF